MNIINVALLLWLLQVRS